MNIMILIALLMSYSAMAEKLQDVIPHPFYVVQDQSENQLTLVDNGLVALQLRLDMIKKAKKTIEVEYFIYKTDRAGKLLTLALIDAAKRGVKVRILADKTIIITELNRYHAHEFKKLGIEMRYYNALGAEYALATQFRNHRKLITVDDEDAITGGRNIGEDYFNMSAEYNYTDRDILVKGPMAKAMRESFDSYFDSKISTLPKELKIPDVKKEKKYAKFQKKLQTAIDFLTEDEESIKVREKVELLSRPLVSNLRSHTCPETTFASDAPGFRSNGIMKPSDHVNFRYMRRVIFDRISKTDKELIIASPYMINNKASLELMQQTINRGTRIILNTNSLASTDAIYMAANMYDKIKTWARKDVLTYLHNSFMLENDVVFDEFAAKSKWGVHEKTQIYESVGSAEVMIGSYNIDNRSYHFNNELGILCKGNPEFTQEVKTSILERAHQGILFTSKGKGVDKDGAVVSIYGSRKTKHLLMRFLTLPSKILKYFL